MQVANSKQKMSFLRRKQNVISFKLSMIAGGNGIGFLTRTFHVSRPPKVPTPFFPKLMTDDPCPNFCSHTRSRKNKPACVQWVL